MASHKVKIAARLRPRLENEVVDDEIQVYSSRNNAGKSAICVTNPRDVTQQFKFPFTSCYGPDSTQDEIYDNDVHPLIDVVYSGVTVTVFAYGVTSSGKTHTMQGNRAEPGVIPRVVRGLFDRKSKLERNYSSISLTASYMEIYKDEVYDLLLERESAPKLPVRENDAGQVFVANLTYVPVCDADEFDVIYARSNKRRSVGSTNLNNTSSRSHAVLTIEVAMLDSLSNKTLVGKINLVDLAGSENNKLTGNDPSRMAESAAINKSLSVLGQVVHALNQGASRIPYRNSKLTRILQDALGGSSVGLLICNLAPGVKFRQDTLNTLNFAVRTKNVENKPVVNEKDNRVQPRPHFAAIQPTVPKPASVILQTAPAHAAHPSLVPHPGRSSLIPNALNRRRSRAPRASAFGASTGVIFQPLAIRKSIGGETEQARPRMINLSENEFNERISKAVEAEVERRLEEKEHERVEEERLAKESQPKADNRLLSPKKEPKALPSGILTPLIKRHKDLDEELKTRLYDLEKKFENTSKDDQFANVLSPISKKKMGRAYVALARGRSEKGDLQVALDLYRKAEEYVPDNVKLKERIIEIEWAVKNGTEFVPSPRAVKPRKPKGRKKTSRGSSRTLALSTSRRMDLDGDDAWRDEEEENDDERMVDAGLKAVKEDLKHSGFGAEVTNNLSKRAAPESEGDTSGPVHGGTLPKKRRSASRKQTIVEVISDGEWIPPASKWGR